MISQKCPTCKVRPAQIHVTDTEQGKERYMLPCKKCESNKKRWTSKLVPIFVIAFFTTIYYFYKGIFLLIKYLYIKLQR